MIRAISMWTAVVAVVLFILQSMPCLEAAKIGLDGYNFCLLTEVQSNFNMECMMEGGKAGGEFRKIVEENMTKFPGLSMYDVSSLICKANGDRGEEVADEFIDSFPEHLAEFVVARVEVCFPKAIAME